MASSNRLKGLTVEIGGNTKPLSEALQSVNKNCSSLQKELNQVNKLLKLDPDNVEMTQQKMTLLQKEISSTAEKLKTLKEAQKQAQEQFDKGEITEEQYRALQREIAATENKLDSYNKELNEMTDTVGDTNEKLDKHEEELDDVADASGKASEKSSKFGDVMKTLGNAAVAATAAVGAAAVKLGTEVVQSFSEYEQLKGGVETLFGTTATSAEEYAASVGKSVDDVSTEFENLKEAQFTVSQNATNAFKSSGLSINEYMETVTGFSASLISSLGGDTLKAAEYADIAITDMSDNANKMGTDMESIQNAYQGFAKQNYTMLDNLKLGYGGTKEEMERLLEDATKISGIEYDVSSYADVVSAIHVIQEEMGIAGATAEEAEGTIEGSFNTMKAAAENLVLALGGDFEDIDAYVRDVADAFSNLVNNVEPVLESIVETLPIAIEAIMNVMMELLPTILEMATSLFDSVLAALVEMLPGIADVALQAVATLATTFVEQMPAIIDSAAQIINTLINTLTELIPTLIPTAITVITTIWQTLFDNLPTIAKSAVDMIYTLATTYIDNLPEIVDSVIQIVESFTDTIDQNLPWILEAAVHLIVTLVEGLIDNLPEIIETAVTIINTLSEAMIDNLPFIIDAAIKLMKELVSELIDNLPMIIDGAFRIIDALARALLDNLPLIIEGGLKIIVALAGALVSHFDKFTEPAKQIITKIKDKLVENFSKIRDAGKDLVEGLWNGISDKVQWICDKVAGFGSTVLKKIKSIFGINSPSKETAWMGRMLDEGLAGGIDEYADKPIDAMNDMKDGLISEIDAGDVTFGRKLNASFSTATATEASKLDTLIAICDAYLPDILKASKKSIVLDSGTLVGETIDDIDKSLYSRYSLAARGV